MTLVNKRIIFALLVSGSLLILAALFNPAKRIFAGTHPNILLITVDSLRADHLGCYGYQRDTSPNIDKLAKEGATFLSCFAVSSSTPWSLAPMLTGRYLYTDEKYDLFLDNILDKGFITLSAYLKKSGYYTAGFVSTGILRVGRGFEQGFDYYKYYKITDRDNTKEITSDISDFISKYRLPKPFFIWVHYFGPHLPYHAQKTYLDTFLNDRLYRENDKVLGVKSRELYRHQTCPDYLNGAYIPPEVFRDNRFNLNYYKARYDAAVLYTDFYIGKLLESVKDSAIVILTADHGESLGEHNVYFSHAKNIYDELLHVPLIIKDNGSFAGGRTIPKAVSSVDIVPTVLSRVKPGWYYFNKNRFNGIDLGAICGNRGLKRRYIYSYFPDASSIRDVDNNIKYILPKDTKKREELYRLPDENNNLIDSDSLAISWAREGLKESLKAWLREIPHPVGYKFKESGFRRSSKE